MRSHAHALLASALNSLIRIAATLIRIASTLIRIASTLIRIAATAIRIIGACVRHKAQHTTRRIHVAAAQAVPVQMWQRRGPVSVQMWRAQSRCRCGRSGVGGAAARTCSLSDRSGRAAPWALTSCGNTKQHTATLRGAVDGLLPSDRCSEYCTVPRRWRTGALAATCRTEPAGQNRVAAACDVARVGGSWQGRPKRVLTPGPTDLVREHEAVVRAEARSTRAAAGCPHPRTSPARIRLHLAIPSCHRASAAVARGTPHAVTCGVSSNHGMLWSEPPSGCACMPSFAAVALKSGCTHCGAPQTNTQAVARCAAAHARVSLSRRAINASVGVAL